MLQELTIENFRSFDKYHLSGLARVNLLVGDNNCGKTSVLEAVQLLVTGDGIPMIQGFRNDFLFGEPPLNGANQSPPAFPLANLFHGEYSRAEILEAGVGILKRFPKIRLEGQLNRKDKRNEIYFGISPDINTSQVANPEQLNFTHLICQSMEDGADTKLLSQPVLLINSRIACGANWSQRGTDNIVPFLPIPNLGLNVQVLINVWGKLLETRSKNFAVNALRILVDDLVDVNIAPTARSSSQILIDRVERNETLASLGAGSYRMLTIGAVLAATRKGIVTIDEIDTGLHYSRMADMWKMVIGAARDLDVQVFATTHSLDCLNSLEKALLTNSDLCQHVAVHRVEREINTAVTLDSQEFLRGMQRESEIR